MQQLAAPYGVKGYNVTLDQIKAAVLAGKSVHWKHDYYVVRHTCGQRWLIVYREGEHGENSVGLTWTDGTTLNGKESDFFIG